ncbi:MAG: DDE-type integrase/transposase/recombinase [Acetobacteraceae bacterium]|nr:DDE-type integrase/transposase/recombinase [Acetobacteraceae bacterium]
MKVKGRWTYLYRAGDSRGQTIDFLLSARRDAEAVKRFFRKALAQPHAAKPRTITVDKNAAYPKATAVMKRDGKLWRRSRLRQVKYLNNIVEHDHRRVKGLIGPGLGFGSFWTARRTLCNRTHRRAIARPSGPQHFPAKPWLGAGLEPFVDRRAGKAVGDNDCGVRGFSGSSGSSGCHYWSVKSPRLTAAVLNASESRSDL